MLPRRYLPKSYVVACRLRFGGIWVAFRRGSGSAEVALGLCLGRVSQEVGRSPAVCRRLQSGLPPGRTYLPHCQGRCVADKEHQVIGFWLAVMQGTPFARTASRQSVQVNAQISRTQPAALSSSWGCLLGSLSVACVVIIMGLSLWRWMPPGGAGPPPDASVAPCPANGQRGADPWHLGGVWVAFQLA